MQAGSKESISTRGRNELSPELALVDPGLAERARALLRDSERRLAAETAAREARRRLLLVAEPVEELALPRPRFRRLQSLLAHALPN